MIMQRLIGWLEYRIWLARIAARGRGTAQAIPLALGWATVGVLAYHAPGMALCAGLVAIAVILTRAALGDYPALRELHEMAKTPKEKVASESDVFRKGLRALQAQEQSVERWLREDVAKSFDEVAANPGGVIPVEEVLARIKSKNRQPC